MLWKKRQKLNWPQLANITDKVELIDSLISFVTI
jgi:hypothetical protein